ncbi:MAG TPA: TonB-dependent receptor [Ohtaekwangia sp.]
MKKAFLFISYVLFSVCAVGQNETQQTEDSTEFLSEITVEAYQYHRTVIEVPASVGIVQQKDFTRFSNTSLLPVLNTLPGVRMEERSPGSYRVAMRGSSLRSPFGVRNVKVYWNDLPFTDAGGNTYLNLFDFNSIQNIEAVKGPGSSLYGAGTGGALLLSSGYNKDAIQVSTVNGSYDLLRYTLSAQSRTDNASIRMNYGHQQSDGYREQSRMIRDAVQVNGDFVSGEKGLLSATILYSDLFYETPGGLTKEQFEDDPTQARPPGGPNPGAAEQHASVFNRTFYSGLSYAYEWNEKWSNQTGVYGSFTQFENPTLRPLDYERRTEQGFGGRTNTTFSFTNGRLNFGAEFQHGFSPIKTYESLQGQSGVLQNDDEISIMTYFVFVQAEVDLPANFLLTVGASLNKLNVDFKRLSVVPPVSETRNYNAILSPRIAVLKKLTDHLSAYASYSQGYSPPTIQELYASNNTFNQNLGAERGTNLELGFKGDFLQRTLHAEIAAYNFRQEESIVIRHDANEADYFVNEGETNQNGIEILTRWSPVLTGSVLSNFSWWISYTLNKYEFEDYERDGVSFDGNALTGVAPNILSSGIDLALRSGIYANVTFAYTDEIPLNDANTEYADVYSLLGGRAGYRKAWKSFSLDAFLGIDNALDEHYSLGHELNAVGGRYYNPAPVRNYYFGITAGLPLNQH